MKIRTSLNRAAVCLALLACTGAASVQAQNAAVRTRVTQTVDDTVTVRLQGNVHPLAKPAFDQGALPDSQPLTRMLLLLQRSPEQELALRQLLDAQVTKNSGSYHAWLTPDQFGKQFGPADSDVQAVTDWLTKQGFTVRKLAAGKTAIEFDGNVAQVRNAFHTEIHRFVVNGEQRFANVSDPAIPQALSPVVAGVAALHNFPKHSYVTRNGYYRRYKDTGKLEPLFTFGSPVNYALGPTDFRTIYSIPTSADGSGQAIAIIADSNINTADINSYRSLFGLPAYTTCTTPPTTGCLNVIVNGPDPGLNGDEVEADLDTQLAGGVAPNAAIYLVVTEPTLSNPNQVSQGVDLSALYAVDNNLAPVISDSFGECEAGMLLAGNQFYNALWEQAASQGITVAVATGDNGSAACDPITTIDPNAASQGLAVSGLASTPFNVAVGGTDFDPTSTTTSASTYWKPNTTGDVINSALTYIPETTWDDSACAAAYPTACTSVDTSGHGADISAGSGGPSNCILGVQQSNGNITCPTSSSFPNGGYLKPSFQTGLTPSDSLRDIPDVSFYSSNGGPISGGAGVAYVICQSDTNPQGSTTPTGAACSLASPYTDFSLVGGTSAATPAFAAIMAMVNQTQGRQGNANYVLYKLANNTTYSAGSCQSSLGQTPTAGCVFNDVSRGNISVACDGGTPNCSNASSGAGQFGVLVCNSPGCNNTAYPNSTGVPAFKAASGYDLATGLGSINVGNLLTSWTSAIRTATTTTLASPTGGSPSGTNFTASVSVSPVPTGPVEDVSLIALASDKATVLGSYGPFALSGGTASVSTNLLPPGTTYVEGSYGGDASLGASTSQPVALSGAVQGAGQTSKLTVYYVGFNSSGAPTTPTTSSQNFVYGSGNGYILQVVVTGTNGTACAFSQPATKPSIPCPTGTIKLFDNGNALNDFTQSGTATNQASLNNQGFAEDQPINVNAGNHAITATYSGDPNYNPTTTSNTLNITITQASTTTTVATSLASITAGTSVTITATVGSTSGSPQGPTGTVTFTSNGSTIGTGTCTPAGATSTVGAFCTATLTTSISALYPPPSGRPGAPNFPRIPLTVALLSLLLFVLGLRFVPQTRKRAYTYAGLLVIALLVGVVAGCGGGGGGSSGGSGSRNIGATYPGDTNYKQSSGSTQIIVQ